MVLGSLFSSEIPKSLGSPSSSRVRARESLCMKTEGKLFEQKGKQVSVGKMPKEELTGELFVQFFEEIDP